MTAASERAARVGLRDQLRPAHADPRAAVARMHDGAQAGNRGARAARGPCKQSIDAIIFVIPFYSRTAKQKACRAQIQARTAMTRKA